LSASPRRPAWRSAQAEPGRNSQQTS